MRVGDGGMVSVICPVYNEERYIKNCVESILSQDYPLDDIEILFVDGMSTDRTKDIITGYSARYGFIKLLENPERTAPAALNKGIETAKGGIIIRLDGHCTYPENYISVLVNKLHELDADNVGAMINTVPADDTPLCRAIAIGMSHAFGVGNSWFRIGRRDTVEVDTVPFGCFRRNIFDRVGLFDPDLIRNQDDEFNARIRKNGGKIFLIPNVKIGYYARDSIGKMAKMFYQYGLFKPLVNKKIGKPAAARQFAPVLFLTGLVLGFILSFFSTVLLYCYLSGLLFYCAVSLFFSIKESSSSKEIKLVYLLPCIFFVIHVSYGCGYWIGIGKAAFNKKIRV